MDERIDWMDDRDRVRVMGILNITPDSFYDGGADASAEAAIARGLALVTEGADLLDIGGESSRPGSDPVSESEELRRVLPVIKGLRERTGIPISIDTTKATVAREAIALGATIVNDISAMQFDEAMTGLVAETGASIILMHMLGTPKTMQKAPSYDRVVEDLCTFFEARIAAAMDAGISRDKILIDPGIGFGKRLDDNLSILRDLKRFRTFEVPVVVGLSRKSFLGQLTGGDPQDRLAGTIAANAVAVARGADIIRVHDVKEGRQTADVAVRLRNHEL